MKELSFNGTHSARPFLPLALVDRLYNFAMIRMLNPHVDPNDPAEMVAIRYARRGFSVKQMFVSPFGQVDALSRLGFEDIHVLSSLTGNDLDIERSVSQERRMALLCL